MLRAKIEIFSWIVTAIVFFQISFLLLKIYISMMGFMVNPVKLLHHQFQLPCAIKVAIKDSKANGL